MLAGMSAVDILPRLSSRLVGAFLQRQFFDGLTVKCTRRNTNEFRSLRTRTSTFVFCENHPSFVSSSGFAVNELKTRGRIDIESPLLGSRRCTRCYSSPNVHVSMSASAVKDVNLRSVATLSSYNEKNTNKQPKNGRVGQPKQRFHITSDSHARTSVRVPEIKESPSSSRAKAASKTQSGKAKSKASNGCSGKCSSNVTKMDLESAIGTKMHLNSQEKPLLSIYPPQGKSVVVVESVTKAKIIQGYLGEDFEVIPTYGHVRDLAARSNSVRPDEDFSMVWEVPQSAWTHLRSIKVALNRANNLILASDPDREGEAIAWHILEMLKKQNALHNGVSVSRVVFNEISEPSILRSLQAPRQIDMNLVHAYLARRALDYLIGFKISPLLWRKLPSCQSAGRVQSAALSLICDREVEIDEFRPQEFWTIDADFRTQDDSEVCGHLSHFESKKLNQFSIPSRKKAMVMDDKINSSVFNVIDSRIMKSRKSSPAPLITSTLQQEAASKLHFTTSYTMKLAQKLYEGVQLPDAKAKGLITYIRTDGLHISDEAVEDIYSFAAERYGKKFVPDRPRKHYKKIKNAQEAHEAIRPTNIRLLPSMLSSVLDDDSLKLYTLIWLRTIACQMESVGFEQIQVDIGSADKSIIFRSICSHVSFIGFRAVFEDSEAAAVGYKDTEDDQKNFEILKSLKLGDSFSLAKVVQKQHFTQPSPRYSEGSLVKKLEELGIGRPSTYASTLKVLQERGYVIVKNRVLHPEFRGRMVSAFLSDHFTDIVDYSFTADMETELDNVSAGQTEWKNLLKDYWTRFSQLYQCAENIRIHEVEMMLQRKFEKFLFGSNPASNRRCPRCTTGTLIFKVSRFGSGYFVACDQHPSCKFVARTLCDEEDNNINDDDKEIPQSNLIEVPKLLGLHPHSNEKILLKNGPYGSYIQLGEERKGAPPKRVSLNHIKDARAITYEDAIALLQYPVTLGTHPTDGHPVKLNLSRSGFSITHKSSKAFIPKGMKPDEVTLQKALEVLEKNTRKRKDAKPRKAKKTAQ